MLISEKINVCEKTKYNNLFPGKRFADAKIKHKNGKEYKSKLTEGDETQRIHWAISN